MADEAQVAPWQRYLAELIGTFFLVLAGAGAVVLNEAAGGGLTALGVPAAFGVALAMIIYAIGHISGAHVNPAVTIAFALSRDFPVRLIPGYIVSQVAGATMAALILRLLFGDVAGLGATVPSGSVQTALLAEAVLAFVLMFVVESVATDTRAIGSMAGLAAGAALLLGVFLGGPISGGSLNPARTFGPALVAGEWSSHWVYWLAPIVGASAGALTYRLLRTTRELPAARGAAAPEELPAGP